MYARLRGGGDGEIWCADIAPELMLGRRADEYEYMIDPRTVSPWRMNERAVRTVVGGIALTNKRDGDYYRRAPAGYWPSFNILATAFIAALRCWDVPHDRVADVLKGELAPRAWNPDVHGIDDRPLTGVENGRGLRDLMTIAEEQASPDAL
jgi:hypothetical protein